MKATPQQRHVDIIVETLQKIVGTNTSYIIHYRDARQSASLFPYEYKAHSDKPHFDLVVFSQRTGDGLHHAISELVAQKSANAISANVLLHKTEHLDTRSLDMQWFFDRVLRNGIRICYDSHYFPIARTAREPERDFAQTMRFWHKCEAVACVYSDAAAESPMLDVELVKVSLLTQATEYVLLGLIRIFLGYIPNHFDLKFLFALSRSFTDLPNRVFEPQSETGKRCLRHLCAPATMLRHWDNLKINEPDFEFLQSACAQFKQEASRLAQQQLYNPSINLKI